MTCVKVNTLQYYVVYAVSVYMYGSVYSFIPVLLLDYQNVTVPFSMICNITGQRITEIWSLFPCRGLDKLH